MRCLEDGSCCQIADVMIINNSKTGELDKKKLNLNQFCVVLVRRERITISGRYKDVYKPKDKLWKRINCKHYSTFHELVSICKCVQVPMRFTLASNLSYYSCLIKVSYENVYVSA